MNDYKELIKALRCCGDASTFNHCDECPHEFQGEDCFLLETTAADAIEQLVKERDAAVADLHQVLGGGNYSGCDFCTKAEYCDIHGNECKPCSGYDRWEWRGVREDNDG